MIFVCEDNNFAVHTRRNKRQSFNCIGDLISQFGCNVFEEKTTDPEKAEFFNKKDQEALNFLKSKKPSIFLHSHELMHRVKKNPQRFVDPRVRFFHPRIG